MEAIEHGTETNKNVVKQKNKTNTKEGMVNIQRGKMFNDFCLFQMDTNYISKHATI